MKKLFLSVLLTAAIIGTVAEARYTHSYVRSDGTYVNGYYGR